MRLFDDTDAETEAFLVEGYRRMTPEQKWARVFQLNAALEQLQTARILDQYGPMPERELKLRLAALRIPRDLMIAAFGWDPEEHGL